MTTKLDCQSEYDQCNTLLLSAFFSLTGQSAFDDRLRKAIEDVLIELIKAQDPPTPSNVIPFCRRRRAV
ncbi:hypothetical protein [Bosea psychrotolerans]|uniref:hypothetical protein n=1 Tax=Bosea psychrotolerans TaxID=1871628 RepID=UPI0011B05A66|nr:hypothetical protein [Bosea psychrotolerans]